MKGNPGFGFPWQRCGRAAGEINPGAEMTAEVHHVQILIVMSDWLKPEWLVSGANATFSRNPTEGKPDVILVDESRAVKFEVTTDDFLPSSMTATYVQMLCSPRNVSFGLKLMITG